MRFLLCLFLLSFVSLAHAGGTESTGESFGGVAGGGGGAQTLRWSYHADGTANDWFTDFANADCLFVETDRVPAAGCALGTLISPATAWDPGVSQWLKLPAATVINQYGCVNSEKTSSATTGLGTAYLHLSLEAAATAAIRIKLRGFISIDGADTDQSVRWAVDDVRAYSDNVTVGLFADQNAWSPEMTIEDIFVDQSLTYPADAVSFLFSVSDMSATVLSGSHTGEMGLHCWVTYTLP